MDKKEIRERFYENVEYLKRNIPPEEIYPFAEETLMACIFFIQKWGEWVDIPKECQDDEVAAKWILNIMSLYACREQNVDVKIELNLNDLEN